MGAGVGSTLAAGWGDWRGGAACKQRLAIASSDSPLATRPPARPLLHPPRVPNAEYTHWKQPSGWTLPAFSWYLDQTIGGAVATGTHGSSMRYGSLSSQVGGQAGVVPAAVPHAEEDCCSSLWQPAHQAASSRTSCTHTPCTPPPCPPPCPPHRHHPAPLQLRGIQMILANGSLVELTPASNLHLFLAAGVSVGRLGVITQVVLAIKPQQAVQRSLKVRRPVFSNQLCSAWQMMMLLPPFGEGRDGGGCTDLTPPVPAPLPTPALRPRPSPPTLTLPIPRRRPCRSPTLCAA